MTQAEFLTAGDVDGAAQEMTGEFLDVSDSGLLERAVGGEEATQEVFLALIREGGRFDAGRGSVASYLYGIARNHVLRCLERDRPYVRMEDEHEGWASSEDTLGDLARGETIESVRQAVLA